MAVVELMNPTANDYDDEDKEDEKEEEWIDSPTELYLQLNEIAEIKLKIDIKK